LAPEWSQLEELLLQDIQQWGQLLFEQGVLEVLNSLAPQLHGYRQEENIVIHYPSPNQREMRADHLLVLIPSSDKSQLSRWPSRSASSFLSRSASPGSNKAVIVDGAADHNRLVAKRTGDFSHWLGFGFLSHLPELLGDARSSTLG
jgi:hypothetical protein